MLVEKPLIGQTVIAPYMKDAKFCRDVYGERLHLSTRFEPDSVRKTEVTADSTI